MAANRLCSAGTIMDHNLRVRTSMRNAFICCSLVLPEKQHQCGFTHVAKQREVVLAQSEHVAHLFTFMGSAKVG